MAGQNNKNYSNYMRYYSDTSEARSLNHLEEPKRTVRKARRVRRRKAVFRYIEDNKASLSIYAVITIILFFGGLFSTVTLSAMINSGRSDIVKLNNELKKEKEAFQLLQVEITNSYDLVKIEKIATTKLGMSQPKSHQIVHISVPKKNYTVKYKQEEAKPEQIGGFSYLFGLVKRVLRIE